MEVLLLEDAQGLILLFNSQGDPLMWIKMYHQDLLGVILTCKIMVMTTCSLYLR